MTRYGMRDAGYGMRDAGCGMFQYNHGCCVSRELSNDHIPLIVVEQDVDFPITFAGNFLQTINDTKWTFLTRSHGIWAPWASTTNRLMVISLFQSWRVRLVIE